MIRWRENAPGPITQTDGVVLFGNADYNSTDSTSATNLAASSPRYEATTLNTASEKPPMFRMSSRSGACVDRDEKIPGKPTVRLGVRPCAPYHRNDLINYASLAPAEHF